MNITGILDGEKITVKNLTGNVSESAIVYIDSSDNLIVKTAPIQDRNKIIFSAAVSNDSSSSLSTFPTAGKIAVLGTSTVARCYTSISGTSLSAETENSMWAIFNARIGNKYDFDYYGYAGQENSVLKERLLDTILPTKPKTIMLHLGYNDVGDSLSQAEAAYLSSIDIIETCISKGVLPVVITPHLQTDVVGKWGPVNLFNKKMIIYCKSKGIICISGVAAISSNTDKTGTAKPSAMADTLHVASEGAFYYAEQILRSVSGIGYPTYQFTAAGNSELSAFLHVNPHMTGTGAPGTGVSGMRPANITSQRSAGSGGAIGTSGSDHEGSYYDLSISATTSADTFKIVESITSARWVNGHQYFVISDIEILNNTCVNAFRHRLVLNPEITTLSNATRTLNVQNGRYSLVSKPFLISEFTKGSSNESGLYIYCSGAGTCTVRIRYMNVVEI